MAEEERTNGTRNLNVGVLDEYKQALYERGQMPLDRLENLGYSESEAEMLQAFSRGEISFDAVAASTSAVLTATLSAPTHTSSKYALTYNWTWDKQPAISGGDAVGLSWVGINSSGGGLFTNSRPNSRQVKVNYVYESSGAAYETVSPSYEYSGNTIEVEFKISKLDSGGYNHVWAKSGSIFVSIEPTVSGTSLAAVKTKAEYGHTTSTLTDVTVSCSAGVSDVSLSITFGPEKKYEKLGKTLKTFYNNGRIVVE